jgi:hypothetical protein
VNPSCKVRLSSAGVEEGIVLILIGLCEGEGEDMKWNALVDVGDE